jgi:glutaredoxin-like protein NrdH
LEGLGLSYSTIDLTQDAEAMEYVTSLGYAAAPVIVAEDQHWSGFRPDSINALVNTLVK